MQAGLNAPLSKPVDPDVLFETLEGLLRHPHGAEAELHKTGRS
jgi:hypothetical protein